MKIEAEVEWAPTSRQSGRLIRKYVSSPQTPEIFNDHINTVQKLGAVLRRMRKQRGLSQKQLAARAGLRQPTISDIEKGGGTVESVIKIVRALGLNLAMSSGAITPPDSGKKSRARIVLDLLADD